MPNLYTDLLQMRMPSLGDLGWDDEVNDNTKITDFVLGSVLKKNMVISGCAVTDGGGLGVDVAAGFVAVGNTEFTIAAVSKTCTDAALNFIYVDDAGAVQVNTTAPTGEYCALALVDAAAAAIDRIGDCRNFLGPKVVSNNPQNENLLINGSLRMDQKAGFPYQYSVDGSNVAFTDMLSVYTATSGAADFTVTRSGTIPVESKSPYSLKISTVTQQTVVSASDRSLTWFKVEGTNLPALHYGSVDAKNLVLSMWVQSSDTGNHAFCVRHDGTTATHPFHVAVNVANTWEYKTIVIPGDQVNGVNYDSNAALRVYYLPMMGSDYYGTADTWTLGENARAPVGSVNLFANPAGTFYINSPRLEYGSVATPYKLRDYSALERSCFRYYQHSYVPGVVPGSATDTTKCIGYTPSDTRSGQPNSGWSFSCPMRTTPTLTVYAIDGTPGYVYNLNASTNIQVTSASLTNKNVVELFFGAGLTVGDRHYWNWAASAEI